MDEERIQDHMPRPIKLDGTDENTKLLGALVHWVMCNNLLTILNKYPAIQASRDFDVSYAELKRVITSKKQPKGSYYERQCQEQEGKETQKQGKKCKAMNPVDAALAKKKKVTLSVDTTQCMYCGKLYHTGKKLTEHINQEHPGKQTIYACPYCTQPFNQYSEYLQHLGEHKDRIIRCSICNKEFKTITKLRVYTNTHINQSPFCSENFLTPQALQDHVKESHGADPGAVERQCSLCEFTCNSISELAEHNQSVQRPYGCKICFLCFSSEYKLEDYRLAKYEISSLGTSVEVGDQGDQLPEPPEPGDFGIPQQEPTREKGDQGDQPPKPPTPLKEPSSKEPKVPTGSKDPQVEVDKVKGSEVWTEEYDRECEACNHFFSSNMYRHSHITRYHKAQLRWCKMCMRLFMFPWDFDRHLDSQHSRCKVCKQYLVDKEMLQDHMDLEHPTVTVEPVIAEEQVTRDPATLETNCQDCQVKCKYCDRYFRNVAECNMHLNRRHKRVKCPQCEKHFVKQADCDNHVRDVHKFVCSISGCSVFKYNEIELHEHLRYDHRWHFNTVAGLVKHCQDTHDYRHFACTTCGEVFASNSDLCRHTQSHHVKLCHLWKYVKLCHLCHRIFVSEDKLIAHMKEIHLGSTVHTREEMIEDEQAWAHAVWKWFKEMKRKEKKKKKKKKHREDDDDNDEDDDDMYHPSQDYNDDSQVDPKFRPTKRELREADKEGDS